MVQISKMQLNRRETSSSDASGPTLYSKTMKPDVSRNSNRWYLLLVMGFVAFFLIWSSGSYNNDDQASVVVDKIKGASTKDHSYMAVIDAGSSGSRMHIYQYTYNAKGNKVVEPDHVTLKKTPGLSSFESHPSDAGASLEPLIAFAKEHIPGNKVATTPILLKATAGLRLVQQRSPDVVESILQSVRSTLAKSGLQFHASNANLISGQEEGMLGWLALNYLTASSSSLRGSSSSPMWGLIEMGGASVQVSVPMQGGTDVPAKFVLDYTSPTSGQKGSMYTHSFLGLGGESAQKAIHDKLVSELTGQISVLKNPCLPKDFTEEADQFKVSGTGDHPECKNLIDRTLFVPEDGKVTECKKDASHCLWNGIASPVLSSVNKLWAFENFFYIMSGVGEITKDKGAKEFKVKEFEQVAKSMCDKGFSEVDANYPKDTQPKSYNKVWCFSATYVHAFFTKGLGLTQEQSVMIGNSVGKVGIDWALGAVLQHHP